MDLLSLMRVGVRGQYFVVLLDVLVAWMQSRNKETYGFTAILGTENFNIAGIF